MAMEVGEGESRRRVERVEGRRRGMEAMDMEDILGMGLGQGLCCGGGRGCCKLGIASLFLGETVVNGGDLDGGIAGRARSGTWRGNVGSVPVWFVWQGC